MSSLIREAYRYMTLKVLFPWQYKRNSKKPLKEKKAIFLESQLPALSDSLQVLYDRLEAEGGWELHIHCLRESFVDKGTFIRLAMKCLEDMADAEYVFLCDASRVVSCIHPRWETVITQLWHGCGAFKKFGMSTAELIFGGSRRDYEKYPYYKNLDYVTVSSPEVAWAYEEAMSLKPGSGQIQPIGISRTDVFFQEEFLKRARQKLLDMIPEAEGKRVLLYAPTFRGNVSEAVAPDALDLEEMAEELGDQYLLLIKHHPVIRKRPEIPDGAGKFAVDVTESMEIEELLCTCDLCISDYSSLIFEYSLFERPLVFFAYDLEEYGDWRGFYYDYDELTPGPVVRTTGEVIQYIRETEKEFDPERIRAFRNKFMSACDGHATDRLIELVTERRH